MFGSVWHIKQWLYITFLTWVRFCDYDCYFLFQKHNCNQSCSTDEVVLNHEIYLELDICSSCQELFIHSIDYFNVKKPPLFGCFHTENHYRATTFCPHFLHDLLNAYKKRRNPDFPPGEKWTCCEFIFSLIWCVNLLPIFQKKPKGNPFFPLWQKVPWVYWKWCLLKLSHNSAQGENQQIQQPFLLLWQKLIWQKLNFANLKKARR